MSSSGMNEDDNMDISNTCDPPEENNVAQSTKEDQAENRSTDNGTDMDISRTGELGLDKYNSKPECGPHPQVEDRAESSQKCSECIVKFPPSVKFVMEKNSKWEFITDLGKENGGHDQDTLDQTKPGGIKKKCTKCGRIFLHKVASIKANQKGGFEIELTLKMPTEKKRQLDRTVDEPKAQPDSSGNVEMQENETPGRNVMNPSPKPRASRSDEPSTKQSREANKNSGNIFTRSLTNTTQRFNSVLTSISKSPAVKVHCITDNNTFKADTAIMEELKNMNSIQETSRDECNVIIFFCPVSHCVESDVMNAMGKEAVPSCGKPVILVLMHHTREDDYSTGVYNPSETWKNVKHAHVFYHDSKPGLLSCKHNTKAIKYIKKELQAYKQ